MFFIGVGATIVGAAARNIGLTPYQIGLLISVRNVGFITSVTISGTVSDTYEKPRILFIGSIALALSFLTFYVSSLFLVNLLIMFFTGVGMGTCEGATDAMLLDIHEKRAGLHIGVNHFFVTFGAVLITLYLLFLQMDWRNAIVQSGIAVSILALFFILTRLEKREKRAEKLSERLKFLRQERILLLLLIPAVCAVGLEIGSIGILTTFLMELRGFSQVTSKVGLIIFLAGITSGRLYVGLVTKPKQIPNTTLILSGCSTILLAGLYFVNVEGLVYLIVFFSGVTLSGIFPLTITLAGLIYRDISGTAMGIIKMAIPIGGILIPSVLSIISKHTSLQTSLLIFPAFAFLGFFVLFLKRSWFQMDSLDHNEKYLGS